MEARLPREIQFYKMLMESLSLFDDDDISYQHRVSEQVQQLKAFEKAHKVEFVACYSSGQRRYENGYIKPMEAIGSRGKPFLERGLVQKVSSSTIRRKIIITVRGTPACALMARKKPSRRSDTLMIR